MQQTTPAKPWYKELWFWLLVSPMLTLLVSVPIMLTTAFKGADDRVLDNYYKEGRMINHRFEEQKLASLLNLHGDIVVDLDTGLLQIIFKSPINVPEISVEFSHPAKKELDWTQTIKLTGPDRYSGSVDEVAGRWYVVLTGEHQGQVWRIPTEIVIEPSGRSSQSFRAEF